MSVLRRILENKNVRAVGIHFGATIIAKAIPFFLLPIITTYLLPEEYGKWAIFLSVFSFFCPIINFALGRQIGRNYYSASKDTLARMIWNLFLINLSLAGFAFVCIYAITFFDKELVYSYGLYFIPGISLLSAIKICFFTILRYEKRSFLFGFFFILDVVIMYTTAMLLILVYEYTWTGMLLGLFSAACILGGVSCVYLIRKKYIRCEYTVKEIKHFLKIGGPLIGHTVGGVILTVSDRIILNVMLNVEVVGVYSVGYMLGMITLIIILAFNTKWEQWINEKLAKITEKKKRTIVKVTYIYYALLPILGISVCAFGHIYMTYFIDVRYRAALPVLYWATGIATVQGFSLGISPYTMFIGKTFIYPIATGIAAIINVFLTIYLIRLNGMVGAAQATFVSLSVMVLILFIYTQKSYPMPWLTSMTNKNYYK